MTESNDLESQLESLGDELDGADLFTVLSIVADAEGESMPDFLSSMLATDLINATQSNPARSREVLIEMSEVDNHLADL